MTTPMPPAPRRPILARGLLTGAALAVVLPLMPAPALAEEAAGEAAAGSAVALEPLTVTARRRAERASEAPVSVTVIGADRLGEAGVRDLDDAARAVPNATFSPQGGPLTIRGIGSLGMSGGVDRQPGVGLFVDDVYIARPNGYPTAFQDLDRVEVVRGAQSTLYGKNTIGGAVNLVSPVPGADPGITATAGLGTDRRLEMQGVLDTPLGDAGAAADLAVRAMVGLTRDDGFIRVGLRVRSGTPHDLGRVVHRQTQKQSNVLRVLVREQVPRDVGVGQHPSTTIRYDVRHRHRDFRLRRGDGRRRGAYSGDAADRGTSREESA